MCPVLSSPSLHVNAPDVEYVVSQAVNDDYELYPNPNSPMYCGEEPGNASPSLPCVTAGASCSSTTLPTLCLDTETVKPNLPYYFTAKENEVRVQLYCKRNKLNYVTSTGHLLGFCEGRLCPTVCGRQQVGLASQACPGSLPNLCLEALDKCCGVQLTRPLPPSSGHTTIPIRNRSFSL